MRYEPLDYISQEEAEYILKSNDIEKLRILPLSIGEYCGDWKFAQDICLLLTKYSDEELKANAILGLSFIARNHGILEKKPVEKSILRVMRSDLDFKSLDRVLYSAEDIYLFMRWKQSLAYKFLKIVCKLNLQNKKCEAHE